MPCCIKFVSFQIRSLAEAEKRMSIPILVKVLREEGFRLASTGELRGPGSEWIIYNYPHDFCILAVEDETTRVCLWSPVLKTYERIYNGIIPSEATDIALVPLEA